MSRLLCLLSGAIYWFAALPLAAWGADADATRATATLEVRFLSVGQGDAAFIRSPTGKTVLIDGGPPEASKALADRVDALVEGPLDLLLLSHPHLDHLGGMETVLTRVGARRFMEPDFDHPTEALARLREKILALGIIKQLAHFPTLEEERRLRPEGAEQRAAANRERLLEIGLGGGATLEVHWPRRHAAPFLKDTRSDANANSIIARLRFGKTAVLFTGDAEHETEKALLASGRTLTADVLKVAHHGSQHSSKDAFLQAVSPAFAVVSAGRNNDYGHPHPALLTRLKKVGAKVLRTDRDGELVFRSDGTRMVKVEDGARAVNSRSAPPAVQGRASSPPPSRAICAHPLEGAKAGPCEPAGEGYVASRRSEVFHRPECKSAIKIKPENRLTFTSRARAAKDRRPAKDCSP